MFRVSQHPSPGVLKTVPAASSTGHTTCTATPLQRGPDHTIASVHYMPVHVVLCYFEGYSVLIFIF